MTRLTIYNGESTSDDILGVFTGSLVPIIWIDSANDYLFAFNSYN